MSRLCKGEGLYILKPRKVASCKGDFFDDELRLAQRGRVTSLIAPIIISVKPVGKP